MAWIRSEQTLLYHPKTAILKDVLKVDVETVIGRLHMLWWWCLDYAIDGDLRKHNPKIIEKSCRIPLGLLISSGFCDRAPYRRIHDWWDNQGNYLKVRFRDRPEKWMQIRDLYQHPITHRVTRVLPSVLPASNPMDVEDVDLREEKEEKEDVKEKEETAALALSQPTPEPPGNDFIPKANDPEVQKQIEAQSYEARVRKKVKARLQRPGAYKV